MKTVSHAKSSPPLGVTGGDALVPDLLDAKQLTKRLKISTRNLHELTQTGKIRSVRIGRLVRYDPRDVTAYLESTKVGGYDHLRKPDGGPAAAASGGAHP